MVPYGRQISGEPFRRINSVEAKAILDEGSAVVVDVRTRTEWETGHVKGAIWIIVDELLGRMDDLPSDKTLLFICAQGVRSALACEMAAASGFQPEKVYNVEDGTPAWIGKGYPTEYGA